MTLNEIVKETFARMKTFNARLLLPSLRAADNEVYGGAIWDDVMNTNGCANYQFSACLMDVVKPKQVVELGGAMGMWSLCVLHTLPAEAKLFSITLPEGGKEFMFVVDKYPNFFPIVGDDLDIKNWNGVDLSQTDVWYFDSLHDAQHIHREMELYSPFFKKGAIILFDDIHQSPEFEKACEEIRDGKYCKLDWIDTTDPLHWTGWGVAMA